MTRRPGIRLDAADTVVTLLEDADRGDEIEFSDDETITLSEDVPFGHKVALVDHEKGDEVCKYDEVIGGTTAPIEAGEWVHTHNCTSLRGQVSDATADTDEESDPETDADQPEVQTE
ncbi:UxaA family hydrolase [Natronolimnobius sp. AArcel1]|uniref:UxaA family hydrolase n=1 Tax=Natronolimnobius sp. AArcel1 TaxID=1679093 RepID=UPI0013ED6838|nr:UxaA family hydrolase [Natronolimnobius sp. AArcel1]NGM70522.1 UxaA family hydrolase [Natronolimnobius sp. AArcel1]